MQNKIQRGQHTAPNKRHRGSIVPAPLLLLTLTLAACGGGSSGQAPNPPAPPPPPPAPPAVEMVFPGAFSLTDAAQIDVVGVTDANRVSAVTVKSGLNSIVAVLDADGRWRASDLPLQPGTNNLVAQLTETDGNVVDVTIAEVRSEPVLSIPSGVAFDETNNRVFIADAKQLLVFDVATRAVGVVSSPRIGIGPGFVWARQTTLDGDGAVLLSDFLRVQRIEPGTGNRTDHIEFSNETLPIATIARDALRNRLFIVGLLLDVHVADLNATPPIPTTEIRSPGAFGLVANLTDSAYVPATDTVYAVGPSLAGVLAIDGVTGDSQQVMLDTGASPPALLVGIEYNEATRSLLILGLTGSVFSFDPVSGLSSTLTSPPPLTRPTATSGLTLGAGQLWSVATSTSELVRIDMSSGEQTIEVDSRVGGGEPPGLMIAGRYDDNANRFVAVADLRIVSIDPSTGSRELLAELVDPVQLIGPQPPPFLLVSGMALSKDGTRAWLADPVLALLAEVNLGTREITEISSSNAGTGPQPVQIAGIAVDANEITAYVGDRFARRVFRIDLTTGQRELLPDFAAALSGSELQALTLDADANRLLLYITPSIPVVTDPPAIYALDLASFQMTLLADLRGIVSPFGSVSAPGLPTTQMSLSEEGSSLYLPVSNNLDVPYVRIDLALGEVTPLGNASSGPPYFIPNAVEATPDGRLFALDGTSALFVIDGETGARAIVSK